MRISTLFDWRSGEIIGDRLYLHWPIVGVADGLNEVYESTQGPRLYEGQSGSQEVGNILEKIIMLARPDTPLRDIVLAANAEVKAFQKKQGFFLDRADQLAGVTFALAREQKECVEIIKAGDTLAIWEMRSGEKGATLNQLFYYEMGLIQVFTSLMEKHGRDRTKAWEEYLQIFTEKRCKYTNVSGGHGLLNGQEGFEKCLFEKCLPRAEIRRIILFTDGFVYYPETDNVQALANRVLSLYCNGGLEAVLEYARAKQEDEEATSHVKQPEATAVVIEF